MPKGASVPMSTKSFFVTTYTWNSTSLGQNSVFPWASSTLRDDGMKGLYAYYCPTPGKMTYADCRAIPYMPGYDMTWWATPRKIGDHCFNEDGHEYCIMLSAIRMDKKRVTLFDHNVRLEKHPLLDCDASCRTYWSGTPDTFSTCSYTCLADNEHRGQRIPFGYEYNDKGELKDVRSLTGCAEWNVNWTSDW